MLGKRRRAKVDRKMKVSIALLALMCLGFVCSTAAQQLNQQQKERFVVVPPQQVLMTAASQPECGIQFDEVRFITSIDGEGSSPSFVVRNNGSKPIREFTIGGPDWTMTWSEKFTKRLLLPGQRAFDDDSGLEIVPLTEKLKDKLKLTGPMTSILVVMVIKVKYADGTTYDAKPIHEALKKYAESLVNLRANAK